MPSFSILLAGLLVVTFVGAGAVLAVQAIRTKRQRDAQAGEAERLRADKRAALDELSRCGAEIARLSALHARLQAELKEKEECLLHLDSDIAWHRAELGKRLPRARRTYRVLTIGVKYTGKTSLTLKWANPLVDLGTLKGTKIERYERTVSVAPSNEALLEHVFEIHDWGGEHIVDAQQELILEEIHGVLLVVDLCGKDAKTLDQARIDEQLRAFQPEVLRFFFGPKTLATCKTVVLFINKSDVLSGTAAEVERAAMDCYKPLIDALGEYRVQMDVRVLVGSASFGHSIHHLFAHFVERILPKSAYDQQLLQRMMEAEPAGASTRRSPAIGANGANGANGRALVEAGHARR